MDGCAHEVAAVPYPNHEAKVDRHIGASTLAFSG